MVKSNTSETYDGKRESLAVTTWLFTVEQYLNLSTVLHRILHFKGEMRIASASSYFKNDEGSRWLNPASLKQAPHL